MPRVHEGIPESLHLSLRKADKDLIKALQADTGLPLCEVCRLGLRALKREIAMSKETRRVRLSRRHREAA